MDVTIHCSANLGGQLIKRPDPPFANRDRHGFQDRTDAFFRIGALELMTQQGADPVCKLRVKRRRRAEPGSLQLIEQVAFHREIRHRLANMYGNEHLLKSVKAAFA
jgi:hypothetical protein